MRSFDVHLTVLNLRTLNEFAAAAARIQTARWKGVERMHER